jgi:hypothetical protein
VHVYGDGYIDRVSPMTRSSWELAMRPQATDDVSISLNARPAAESLIAAIDDELGRAGTLDGFLAVSDHLDVLLDLRLAACEIAALETLDSELAGDSRRRGRAHRLPQRA